MFKSYDGTIHDIKTLRGLFDIDYMRIEQLRMMLTLRRYLGKDYSNGKVYYPFMTL